MTLKQKLINAYSSLGVGETVAVAASGSDVETQLSMFLAEFGNCTARIEKRGTPDYLASNYVVLTKTSIPVAPVPAPSQVEDKVVMPEPEELETFEAEEPSNARTQWRASDVIAKFKLGPEDEQ